MITPILLLATLLAVPVNEAVLQYRLNYLKKQLAQNGLSKEEIGDIFNDLRLYKPNPPPPERVSWEEFSKKLLADESVEAGRRFLQKYAELLTEVHRQHGVMPKDIIALLQIETWSVSDSPEEPAVLGDHVVLRVFYEKITTERKVRRWKWAVDNFVAMVIYCKQYGFDCFAIKGSEEGAFGRCQFIPISLIYARDGNGDEVIDLFTIEDGAMSMASFLEAHGYRKDKMRAMRSYYGYKYGRKYANAGLSYSKALQDKVRIAKDREQ